MNYRILFRSGEASFVDVDATVIQQGDKDFTFRDASGEIVCLAPRDGISAVIVMEEKAEEAK